VLTGAVGAAEYRVEVPAAWNGTLVLFSRGYRDPFAANPPPTVGDPVVRQWYLDRGYALAASGYASTGWAVEDALRDQLALLDLFAERVGAPGRVIAVGASMGGLVTAALVEAHPERFAGGLSQCGVLGGGPAWWGTFLDAAHATKVLLAPESGLEVARIADPDENLALARRALDAAPATAEGRARLALIAALAQTPGWFDPDAPEPPRDDAATRAEHQQRHLRGAVATWAFAYAQELERRAGGVPVGNAGVAYAALLRESAALGQVRALYAQAGLPIEDDLRRLDAAPRVVADPGAAAYLARYAAPQGALQVPLLAMHTTADGLVPAENEGSYAALVRAAGAGGRLRQVFVHRPGHCLFTPAETIAAFQALVDRLDAGQWGDLGPEALNRAAEALGAAANARSGPGGPVPAAPGFVAFAPPPLLRSAVPAAPPAPARLPRTGEATLPTRR
jgi:alpha-beta hydrolase superfamily lysophospholipase